MKIESEQVNDLADFEYDLNGEQFVKLFTKYGGTRHMAEHLWDKFHGYDHSILRLWKALDEDNQEIMAKVLEAWSPRIKNHIQKQEV